MLWLKKDDENSESSTKSCICENTFVQGDHTNGKYRGSAQRDFNTNVSLNYKIPIVFQNLQNDHAHLIMQELWKFDFKINVTPNGIEKYICFSLDNDLVFIYSF